MSALIRMVPRSHREKAAEGLPGLRTEQLSSEVEMPLRLPNQTEQSSAERLPGLRAEGLSIGVELPQMQSHPGAGGQEGGRGSKGQAKRRCEEEGRRKERKEWAIMDTFDGFSPEYDNPMRIKDVKKIFVENGCDINFAGVIKYEGGSSAVVKGTKLKNK
mgnify:CR=1 FL=1